MRSIRRKVIGTVTAVLMASGIGVATATTASASSYSDAFDVDVVSVCRDQGHYGAWFGNWWNPYSLYCYDASLDVAMYPPSFSGGVSYAGPLDIESYCHRHFGDAYTAIAAANNIDGWLCVRR
ncbi:MAG TPA: hypothetical protein VJ841_03485 [Candidatus Saccharimonadales bacterium]|nr:hypothetical protein [Candidatus Saccharimonadales bacterium]